MKFIEKIFYILFPKALLKGTNWEEIWEHQEKSEFLTLVRVFFSITAFGYLIHYYTVDRFEGLAPSELWFNYRFGMAGISVLCLVYYSIPAVYNSFYYYRLPAIAAGLVFCYFQTQTIIWYPKVPYLYSYAFILACTVILRTSILKSIAVSSVYFFSIYPTLSEVVSSDAMIFSGMFFTGSVIVFARLKYSADLKFFLLSQQNLAQQKKIIEINLEFTNQIKAFLPGEIYNRMANFIGKHRMSVLQAVDEVLRPRKKSIACLFSDIRGFTKNSNDLDGFVTQAMYPNVKASTQIIEKNSGICRKVGDLLFAYFDFDSKNENIERALRTAIELSKLHNELNESLAPQMHLQRFFLLSVGEAIVGNLSGYDSSIEITAIGSPVNLLARLDELTKNAALQKILRNGDIILSPDFQQQILSMGIGFNISEVDLRNLGLKVRDFDQISKIFILRVSDVFSITSTDTRRGAA